MTTVSHARTDAEVVARPAQMLGDIIGVRLEPDAVRSVFQPIVELEGSGVVGYETLTRGPAGTPLESPLALFAAVREAGRIADFDGACRDAGLVRARRAGLRPPMSVFLNVEPALVERPWEAPERETWINAPRDLRCVVEITERSLTDRPAELMQAVARIRAASWGVALDDVGADHRSLALMPLLRPDVVKLDLRLVQDRPDRAIAEVVAAVNAYAQETGAVVLAEGIETERHARTALALGARLGQGWRFGRPGALPEDLTPTGRTVPFLGGGVDARGPTPYELVREHQPTRRAGADLVRSIIEHLEELALGLGPATVVLGAQTPERLRMNGAAGLTALSAQAALVGVAGVPHEERLAFRGGQEDGDLECEWSLAVISPHFAAAVVARQLGTEPAGEATYDFAVTHDRALVASCSRAIAARLAPSS